MYNNPYQMQPYPGPMFQRPTQPAPMPENTLIRVTGIDGARAYQMAPNSTVALFDGGEDLMYIKSTDGAGFPTIRTFRFEPIETSQSQIAVDFENLASKDEVDALRKEINDVKQLIQRAKEAKSK